MDSPSRADATTGGPLEGAAPTRSWEGTTGTTEGADITMKHSRRRFERGRTWGDDRSVHALWGALTRRLHRAALDAVDTAATRAGHLVAEAESTRRGTRRRGLVMAAAGFAVVGSMFTAVGQNALAVNFTTANQSMKIHTNYVQGVSAAGFLDLQTKQSGQQAVAEVGFKTAKLDGLCGIATQDLLPGIAGGDVSLLIRAGRPVSGTFNNNALDPNTPVDSAGNPTGANLIAASNLYLNATNLTGYGNKISGLTLGQSADTVAAGAGITFPGTKQYDTGAAAGAFGLSADYLNVAGMAADSYGINLAGQITLPNLSLKVVNGIADQTYCPTGSAP